MTPTWQEFEAQKGIKMGKSLRSLYKKLVPKKMTMEKFWETAQANQLVLDRLVV